VTSERAHTLNSDNRCSVAESCTHKGSCHVIDATLLSVQHVSSGEAGILVDTILSNCSLNAVISSARHAASHHAVLDPRNLGSFDLNERSQSGITFLYLSPSSLLYPSYKILYYPTIYTLSIQRLDNVQLYTGKQSTPTAIRV
jgi:hypothetical protein